MNRIIVHAGFHKTGTTSIQRFLAQNRQILKPHAALLLPGKLRASVCPKASRYSQLGRPAILERFSAAFSDLLADIRDDKPALIVSDELLSGRIPGRDGQPAYHAAPDLMAALSKALHEHFGHGVDLHFLFTTRDPAAWLKSTWMHNLRNSALTQEFDDFARDYAEAANLSDAITPIRAALPRDQVHEARLEDVATAPFGPAEAILRLLDLPDTVRARLTPAGIHNRAPADPDLAGRLLELNRSGLDPQALKHAKAALLAQPIDPSARPD